MSTKQKETDDPLAFVKKPGKKYTLFDYALQPGTVDLKMGAPGEVLLKKSKEAMKKATAHKLVCFPSMCMAWSRRMVIADPCI